jgi:hypothetical protein
VVCIGLSLRHCLFANHVLYFFDDPYLQSDRENPDSVKSSTAADSIQGFGNSWPGSTDSQPRKEFDSNIDRPAGGPAGR